MRTILAELGLIGVVVMGLAAIFGIFSGSVGAFNEAELIVQVKPVYSSQGLSLEVLLRNAGGQAVTIQDVTIDGTSVIQDLGWAGKTLEPGGVLREVIPAPQGLGPGAHTIVVTYQEGGVAKEVAFSFTT